MVIQSPSRLPGGVRSVDKLSLAFLGQYFREHGFACSRRAPEKSALRHWLCSFELAQQPAQIKSCERIQPHHLVERFWRCFLAFGFIVEPRVDNFTQPLHAFFRAWLFARANLFHPV